MAGSVEGENLMSNRERIVRAVYSAVDDLNEQLPKGVAVKKSQDEPLYGKSGQLESLDFVTFIMEVEEKVRAEFGVEVVITDEHLLSKEKSPFSTLGTLTEYLEGKRSRTLTRRERQCGSRTCRNA
jgi:acyl carrier protein